jgi:hypothetical protein
MHLQYTVTPGFGKDISFVVEFLETWCKNVRGKAYQCRAVKMYVSCLSDKFNLSLVVKINCVFLTYKSVTHWSLHTFITHKRLVPCHTCAV